MAEDYLSDREQEEALRQWWRENWRWIVGGVVLGLGLLGGWRSWDTHRDNRAMQAASIYSELRSALEQDDTDQASRLLTDLTGQQGESAYTQQARLLLAKEEVDRGKFEDALALLQTVAAKADDEELAQIARLRAARVLMQLGRYDDALGMLNADKAGAFAAQVRELRGDALAAKGDEAGARAEYAAALAADNEAQLDRTLLEMKLQDVAGESAAPAQANENSQAAAGAVPTQP